MLIPPVNSEGKFKFTSPFNATLDEDKILKVVAVRSISEISEGDEDPLGNIYKANGLTETDMIQDVENNVPIIVFQPTVDSYFYVPASYISSIPLINGKIYQEKILSINLGALPINEDLTQISTDIIELVKGIVGVNSDVKVVNSSAEVLVSYADDDKYTALRNSTKSNNGSFYTRLQKCLLEKTDAINQIKKLECAVKKLYNS